MIPKTLNSQLGKAKNRDPTIPKKIMNNVIVFGLNCHFTNFVEKKGERGMQSQSATDLEFHLPIGE